MAVRKRKKSLTIAIVPLVCIVWVVSTHRNLHSCRVVFSQSRQQNAPPPFWEPHPCWKTRQNQHLWNVLLWHVEHAWTKYAFVGLLSVNVVINRISWVVQNVISCHQLNRESWVDIFLTRITFWTYVSLQNQYRKQGDVVSYGKILWPNICRSQRNKYNETTIWTNFRTKIRT